MEAGILRGSEINLEKLVQDGRVSRRVYTDSDIFELEMERVFGRAWLFVGHESQVPNPGDYITTELARQPVIMIRDADGGVRVLLNRCTHRGAKLVNQRSGNAQRMTCLYHGWTFDTVGNLVGVPLPEGCAAAFNPKRFGLAQAPRIGEYRGFTFASLSPSGISFEDHIGAMRANIDDLVDRAPDGRVALDAGMHRYVYRGNWKLQVENVLDSYHVPFSHVSTVSEGGNQFARREGDEQGALVIDKAKKPSSDWKGRRSCDRGHGHGWTSNTLLDEGKRSSAAYNEYVHVLSAKVGEERAREILKPRLHNSLIYPNVSIMGLNIHVRVIKPIAVDLTEVVVYPVRLVGAPDSMNFGNIRLLNVTHAAASFVQSDDLESFARVQKGLQSLQTEWVDISRGLGAEMPASDGGGMMAQATDELVVRAQYRAWLNYMKDAAS